MPVSASRPSALPSPAPSRCRRGRSSSLHLRPSPERGRVRAGHGDRAERCAALIDALRQRLGPHRVRRFEPVASHLPERAEMLPPVDGETSAWPEPEQNAPAPAVAPCRAGRGHRARSRRSAAAFFLARRDLRRRRRAGPGTHRRRMVARPPSLACGGGQGQEARRAIITSSRTAAATASGSSAKDFTGAKPRRRAGSCKGLFA